MHSTRMTCSALLVAVVIFASTARAADADPKSSPSAGKAEKAAGILPVPDYSGDLLDRAYLLGDLGGERTRWAEKGLTFDIDAYQYFQSVVSGGENETSRYGGVIDWNVALDFDRMGVIPGGVFQMRGVSRFGRSVNGYSGAAIPVNTTATTPTTSDPDDDVCMDLPSITYTQFFSPKFAVLMGKILTYPQSNEFSGGDGKNQFWNLHLVAPVTPMLIIPYSALGAGALIMPTPDLLIQVVVGTSTDVSSTSGFDKLDDGLFGLIKVAYQYELGDLPGGVCNQFGMGFDNDFAEINGRFTLGPDNQLKPTTEANTWFNSLDAWQYLWVEEASAQRVDINNGLQDLQGVGIFARWQFADQDANPIDYTIAAGVCAKGLIPGRDGDTMGLAYCYGRLQDTRIGEFLGIDKSMSMGEFYYNIELTKAVHLSLNAQIVDGVFPDIDTAVILGTQLEMRF